MQEAGQQRFQVQDLAPVLQPLLAALFTAFDKPDSAENEYVMRCIMRVIGFVGPEVILINLQCSLCYLLLLHLNLMSTSNFLLCMLLSSYTQ